MKTEAKQYDLSNSTFGKLSEITHQEHLKLYQGYVNNANSILTKIDKYIKSPDTSYEVGELFRRFSFEYNGVKNHEYYFEQILNNATDLNESTPLYQAISNQWGSFQNWKDEFITLAKTRGVGWAILCQDNERDVLFNIWVDEQHLGHLNSCQFIFGIDMWEHSYVHDYLSSGKTDYINDYLARVDWNTVSNRFK